MPSAQEVLAARARRVTVIRRRVAAATFASFVLCWGAVAWDGSMGAEPSGAAQTTTSAPTATEPADPYSGQATTQGDDGSSLSTRQS